MMSSHVRVVSQGASAAMSQVLHLHTCMKTRLNASYFLFQDNMATMHDILDAQWMYDNYKDGNKKLLKLLLFLLLILLLVLLIT